MNDMSQVESARAFARSLNILLKYVRLYGITHQRTQAQLEVAWNELRAATPPETGLLLGTADGKLVIDGIPLEGHAERSFATLLNNGGIASLHFLAGLMRREFERMIGAFTSGKPAELGAQLKAAVGDKGAIRVNELRFVAQDAAGVAEQLTARTLGETASHLIPWLQDPEKLLTLLAAAEGENRSSGPDEAGSGGPGGFATGEGAGGIGSAGYGGSAIGGNGGTGTGYGSSNGGSGGPGGFGTGEGAGGIGGSAIGGDGGTGTGHGSGNGGSGGTGGAGFGGTGSGDGFVGSGGGGPYGGPSTGGGYATGSGGSGGPGGQGVGGAGSSAGIVGSGGGGPYGGPSTGGGYGTGSGGYGIGSGSGGGVGGPGRGGGYGGSGTGGRGPGLGSLNEETVTKALRLLASIATLQNTENSESIVINELAKDADACSLLRRIMFSIPLEDETSDGPTLAKLAERLAIRFALQQYERGDVKVNAVHELMERMGKEIASLRSVLDAHETKMARAGMAVESYADALDRKFWASVPEAGKKSVLLSTDMWCIPARNVRAYVEELVARGDKALADQILRNCLRQLANEEFEARRKTSTMVSELADLFGKPAPDLLVEALRQVGMRICCEEKLEMQTLLGAAYVRLSQEAGQQRDYPAVMQSLITLERLHEYRPRTAQEVRPRITVDNRLRGFIADAVKQPTLPNGLVPLLAKVPQQAAQELAIQFGQCSLRSQANRFVELAQGVGKNVMECLIGTMRAGASTEVVGTAALLSRLRPEIVEQELPGRIKAFGRPQQDAIVRALAAAGAGRRGQLLLEILDEIDPLLLPEALDEIGFAGDLAASGKLMELAAGEGLAKARPFVRLKAIEALGRVRASDATDMLLELLTPRGLFASRRSRELQLTAARALVSMDPERTSSVYEQGGIGPQELAVGALQAVETDWVRQRRYPRVQPSRALSALAITPKGKCSVEVQRLSLGGGLMALDHRLPRGGDIVLEWQAGLHRLRSHVVLRHLPTRDLAFEVVDMDMDGRGRLRKMILDHAPVGMSGGA